MCRESWKTKIRQIRGFNGTHKYVSSWVIYYNLYLVYVSHHNGMTHMPHDHVFQKLGNHGSRWTCENWKTKKMPNSGFLSGIPKYVSSWVICGKLYLIYVSRHNGITQRPHGHLFQKSRHLGATWVPQTIKQAKIDKFDFFLYDCNQIHYQIGYMGQFVHIICNSSYWYHKEASWPFISKVKASGCNLGT